MAEKTIICVCEKCHTTDRMVTDCPTYATSHPKSSIGRKCSICGSAKQTYLCWAYSNYLKNLKPEEKLDEEFLGR